MTESKWNSPVFKFSILANFSRKKKGIRLSSRYLTMDWNHFWWSILSSLSQRRPDTLSRTTPQWSLFSLKSQTLSAPILVQWVPCFPLFNHYFQKTKPLHPHLKYLFGIWIRAEKYWEFSYRVSVIRVLDHSILTSFFF